MEVTFEYVAEEDPGLPEDFFRRVAEETIRTAVREGFGAENISLSAVAVSTEKIRELNRSYRDKDAATDVLSFAEHEDTDWLLRASVAEVWIGELFFSPEFIRSAATEDGVSLEREMAYVFSHGVLHLLGFDHSDEMFALQDEITDRLAPAA